MSACPPLLAVPNVSEGRDAAALDRIGTSFVQAGARLLDRHEDSDHHRAVFTLSAAPGELALALLAGARQTLADIDLRTPRGAHPHVGALDVVPIVFRTPAQRGAAIAEALVTANLLAVELKLPVFLYGLLGGGRTRAQLRKGGIVALTAAIASGQLKPDFGPPNAHPTAGAVLVGARPPLIAFNIELEPPATLEQAQRIAALIREGGAEGIPGLRAIGVDLHSRARAQVSFNVEDARPGVLAEVLAAVARHHQPHSAELVGLAPKAAFDGFPNDIAVAGYGPGRLLENVLT